MLPIHRQEGEQDIEIRIVLRNANCYNLPTSKLQVLNARVLISLSHYKFWQAVFYLVVQDPSLPYNDCTIPCDLQSSSSWHTGNEGRRSKNRAFLKAFGSQMALLYTRYTRRHSLSLDSYFSTTALYTTKKE